MALLKELWLFIASFLLSFTACYLFIRFNPFGSWAYDPTSGGPQKFHTKPVPRVGGLAIFITLLFFSLFEGSYWTLVLCTLPAFLGGLLEDLTKRVGVRERFFLTMLSGALGYFLLDAYINRVDLPIFDHLLSLSLVSFAFTVFAVGGVANAINIIDGYNGLASGVSLLSLLALGYVSYLVGDYHLAKLCLLLCCAILGFFLWNYPSGSIFLGDGGAYLLGFLIAEVSVLLVQRNPEVSPWFPLLVIAYPVVETLFSIYRKKLLRGTSPGEPDKLHLHMLIYKRLVKVEDKLLRNFMTSPYLWTLSLLSIIPAVIFWKNTLILIALFLCFVWVYVALYRRLVRFGRV